MLNLSKASKAILISSMAYLSATVSSAPAENALGKLSPRVHHKLQTADAYKEISVFVYLKDKGGNLQQKLEVAQNALSPRAFQRRLVNRGIGNLVGYEDIPIHSDYLQTISAESVKVRHVLKALNAISVEADAAVINRISQFDFVSRIELVNSLKRKPEKQSKPVDTAQYHKSAAPDTNMAPALDYGSSFPQNEQLNVPAAHERDYSGNGVVIAVFDSGFNRLTHESFGQMDIAGTWDFVNDDADVSNGSDAGTGGHGTNTLSTLGGYMPGRLIGPAYQATYYLAKTENTESELHVEEDNWCAAAEWADTNGAQIISSSLGYTDFDTGVDYTSADMDGETTVVTLCADLAADNGIVVVNSIGNSGPGAGTLGAPSDGNSVVAVGAITSLGSLSSFSSMGPTADGRIKPDVVAMGSSVVAASSVSDNGYVLVDGTSFSCPLTAGVAALIIEANNNLTAAQVRDLLRSSADNTSAPNNSMGYGIPDALAAVESASGQFAPNATYTFTTSDNRTTTFVNTSNDSDGQIVAYSWDFGDGNTSTEESPTHTFAANEAYIVTLTATDNDGLTDSFSQTVNYEEPVFLPTPPSSSSGGGSLYVGLLGLLSLIPVRKRYGQKH